ncbi:MAG: hypothetical protein FJ279_05235 [Planctomycetes bacterium]|nr:hypothetical protein [Planctomycetota bacterium]
MYPKLTAEEIEKRVKTETAEYAAYFNSATDKSGLRSLAQRTQEIREEAREMYSGSQLESTWRVILGTGGEFSERLVREHTIWGGKVSPLSGSERLLASDGRLLWTYTSKASASLHVKQLPVADPSGVRRLLSAQNLDGCILVGQCLKAVSFLSEAKAVLLNDRDDREGPWLELSQLRVSSLYPYRLAPKKLVLCLDSQKDYIPIVIEPYYTDRVGCQLWFREADRTSMGLWYPKVVEKTNYLYLYDGTRGILTQDFMEFRDLRVLERLSTEALLEGIPSHALVRDTRLEPDVPTAYYYADIARVIRSGIEAPPAIEEMETVRRWARAQPISPGRGVESGSSQKTKWTSETAHSACERLEQLKLQPAQELREGQLANGVALARQSIEHMADSQSVSMLMRYSVISFCEFAVAAFADHASVVDAAQCLADLYQRDAGHKTDALRQYFRLAVRVQGIDGAMGAARYGMARGFDSPGDPEHESYAVLYSTTLAAEIDQARISELAQAHAARGELWLAFALWQEAGRMASERSPAPICLRQASLAMLSLAWRKAEEFRSPHSKSFENRADLEREIKGYIECERVALARARRAIQMLEGIARDYPGHADALRAANDAERLSRALSALKLPPLARER